MASDPFTSIRKAKRLLTAQVKRKPNDGVDYADFRAYMPTHQYIFTPTGEFWVGASVNSQLPEVVIVDEDGQARLGDDGEPLMLKATAWLDIHQPVEQVTWCPGEPQVIHDRLVSDGGWIAKPKCAAFNLYRPPLTSIGAIGDVSLWKNHIELIYGDAAAHLIAWFAHRVQRPQEKINHAIVLGGKQGIGKDTILEPVKYAVGPWNFADVGPAHIMGRFNGFLKSVILRVNEAHDLGDIDRYSFYDRMKSITAAPPDVLRVDEKNLREYNVFNVTGVIITTNRKTDGIHIDPDDRRHYVAWSEHTKEDFTPAYWQRLWDWLDHGGRAFVAMWLKTYDLSGFQPKAPPLHTDAWHEIVDANRAPEDAEMADALDYIGLPDVLTLGDLVTDLTPRDFAAWLKEPKNRRQIPHRMASCGYVPERNPYAKDGLWVLHGRRQVVYAKSALTKAQRRSAASALIGPVETDTAHF